MSKIVGGDGMTTLVSGATCTGWKRGEMRAPATGALMSCGLGAVSYTVTNLKATFFLGDDSVVVLWVEGALELGALELGGLELDGLSSCSGASEFRGVVFFGLA